MEIDQSEVDTQTSRLTIERRENAPNAARVGDEAIWHSDLRSKAHIAIVDPKDRLKIYQIRHTVYAQELGQHRTNPDGMLSDFLDDTNQYITATIDNELAGFISITPPGVDRYSFEKYLSREILPFPVNGSLYELRILTVAKDHRRSRLASALMYAAFRWIEENGGERIIAIGRTEVLSIYMKLGMRLLNHRVTAGNVTFELMETTIDRLRGVVERNRRTLTELQSHITWGMDLPFFKPALCFHGGASIQAIGKNFDALELRSSIINADVLDAWFPPSPKVLDTLREHLPWLLRTSPPASSEGMCAAIARSRGVNAENVLVGAGSSDLIYLAFRQWLNSSSRALLVDPAYGEYAHLLENVIGCQVDRFALQRSRQYAVDLDELEMRMKMDYDLIVLVNPNNPTGQHISRANLADVLDKVPKRTRVWVDEAYIDYIGKCESLESMASKSENVIVCKSMSKVYALSGVRAAYLCASEHQLSPFIPLTPPWAVSLPAQVAAVKALEDENYYLDRYRETHQLRSQLVEGLRGIGVREIVPGRANFVMCHLGSEHPAAAAVVSEARNFGVYLRDVSSMGQWLGSRALRVAVKNEEGNVAIVKALERVLLSS
jgi:histidinol-phosphate/aromatic aminotransferase/cobyric acid decarboxylase-like protein/GNAT superfamily N-acetyltransferase